MIGFILTAFSVCLFIFGYPLIRLGQWVFTLSSLQIFLLLALAIVLAGSVILCRVITDPVIGLLLMKISNHLLGFFIFLCIFVLLFDLVHLVFPTAMKTGWQAFFAIALAFVFTAIGLYQFYTQFEIKEYTIKSDKVTRPYAFLHLTDTQYGTLDKDELEIIAIHVNQVIANEPIDALLFTGDVIDTMHYDAFVLAPLNFQGVKKYFSLGNHEFYHGSQILEIIEKMDYEMLRDQNASLAEINLIGVDDPARGESKNWLNQHLTSDLINSQQFNILLYHRPQDVDYAKSMGVDLMLTGHTHGGQFFPFTYLVNLLYPYPSGLVKLDEFVLYTSDGAGLWGPKMRLGSTNEITKFYIVPK